MYSYTFTHLKYVTLTTKGLKRVFVWRDRINQNYLNTKRFKLLKPTYKTTARKNDSKKPSSYWVKIL